MINISENLKKAQSAISRTVDAYALINGVKYTTEKIVKFTHNDTVMPEGGFTIGNATSNEIDFEIIEEEGVINCGDKIEPFLGIMVEGDVFEYVPLGKFTITELTHKGKVATFKAYDKLYFGSGDYESTITVLPTTTNLILKDVCSKLGVELENDDLEDIPIPDNMHGYSIRDVIGIIAGLYGYNASINRNGKLEFLKYQDVEISGLVCSETTFCGDSLITGSSSGTDNYIIDGDTYFNVVKSNAFEITGLSNYFGDFANTIGDNAGIVVVTKNPYMNTAIMQNTFSRIDGFKYSSCEDLSYRGFLNIQAGDVIELIDVKNNSTMIYITNHVLEFSGGLKGTIKSIGESKEVNDYIQSKVKNKKSLTEIKIELGLIQATVKEYDNKIDEKGNELLQELYSQLQISKDSILTEVSETYYSSDDADELEKRIMSNVTQTASDITTTFTEITTKLDDNLNEYKEEVSTIIREDANGISIGKSDSEIGMNLSNSKLSFTQGDDEIAYLSNKKLMITDAEVKNSLQIGSYQFIPQENGNMSMVWVK